MKLIGVGNMVNQEIYAKVIENLKEEFTIEELKEKLEEFENSSEDEKDDFANDYEYHTVLSQSELIDAINAALTIKMEVYDPEHRAAAAYYDVEPDEVEEESYDHYGLRVFSYGTMEVAVGDDDAANDVAADYIKDALWAFNAEFIAEHTEIGYRDWFVNAIRALQESKYEDSNDDIEDMITSMGEFIDDAISADGRGHFMSSYDGEENEVEIDGVTYYVYRIN